MPRGTTDLIRGWWDPNHVWYERCRLTLIDSVVLYFAIVPSLLNDGAQSVDFGSANRQKLEFFALHIFRGTYEHPIGYNQFQNIPRRAAKFRENRPRDVESLWTEKKDKN